MLSNAKQLKIDSKIQSLAKRAKKVGYIALVGAGAGFAIWCLVVFNAWSQTHRFQSPQFRSPIVFRNPIVRGIIETRGGSLKNDQDSLNKTVLASEKVTPTPAPHFTEKDIVLSYAHGEILWKIYQLESSRGKADYCRNEGKGWGGFGVLSDGKIVCYETFSLASERAEYWLVQNGIDNDIPTTLCKWSGYGAVSTCPYYKSYLLL